ncbi:hypothetical protein AB0I91_13715 [Actinosynnema sp. NPDC049800]
MTNLLDELSQDQKLMIDIIYTHYAAKGRWPAWRYVRRSFRNGSAADPKVVRDSFPMVGDRRTPGPSYSAIHFSPQDLSDDAEYRLCLAAGLHHPRFQITAEKVVEIIRFLADGMKTVDPDTGEITITSTQLARAMRRDPYAMLNLPDFLHHEPMTLITGWSKPEGEKWEITLGDEGLTPYSDVAGLQGYVEKTVELVLASQAEHLAVHTPSPIVSGAVYAGNAGYVDEGLIHQLETLQHPAWHLGRLIAMLHELNSNYAAGHAYSCLMLCRAIIDHVPRLFGVDSYAAVTSMPNISRSERKLLQLLGDKRFSADHVLHHHIGKKADVITMYDVPDRTGMNILIQHVIDRLA